MMKMDQAETPEEIEEVRRLLREYEASLGVSLCFQGFERELAQLPGEYAPPGGRLLLCSAGVSPAVAGASHSRTRGQDAHPAGAGGETPALHQAVGCVALRRVDDETCEMKRLYLRAGFRGRGAGRLLAVAIIGEARKIGYQKMRLDTLAEMREARTLYESLGFKRIEPYYHNPMQGVIFMELEL